ncbi:DNA-directed DNA polymerase [Tanacetum coccineum]|uniref:DNA-directed DNA polymerase n=1 Tax=Tanacetum coccineum TaxID=301880 RepID=A0ABQ5CR75_9ASTR
MEEMLYKFIDEGKREHEEMRAFINEFKTTNEPLFKERSNSLSELRIQLHDLLRVIDNAPTSNYEVKGVTTRGGKTATQDIQNDNTNMHTKEPLVVNHDNPVEPKEVLVENQHQKNNEPVVQPSIEVQTLSIPFPRRLKKEKEDAHQKALPTNKARLEEACTITMNERCSAVLLNKFPSKEKDPGSFTISCDIGQLHIDNALADLGANISLMPYTMYKKLALGESKLTRMSLELADRSIQYPRGIVENVLIKVDKFILHIDFVILDMPKDSRVPIILGRPFLETARAMIDVFNKKITLRVWDNEVIFDVDQSIKRPPNEDDECYGINDLDDTINMETQKLIANDNCESLENKSDDDSDLEKPIRRIDSLNTPYLVAQETSKADGVKSEHLYSASANEIDEKKPELKFFPHDLEYAHLHGDKSFPIIISSELSEKEKMLLLQVLEKRKGAIA